MKEDPQPANVQAIESEPISQISAVHHSDAHTGHRGRRRHCGKKNKNANYTANGSIMTHLDHHSTIETNLTQFPTYTFIFSRVSIYKIISKSNRSPMGKLEFPSFSEENF